MYGNDYVYHVFNTHKPCTLPTDYIYWFLNIPRETTIISLTELIKWHL
jgi:hypothetical protein